MVCKSPKDRVVGPPSKWAKWLKWLINGGDPNHLLTGMILQVELMISCPNGFLNKIFPKWWFFRGDGIASMA